MKPLTELMLGSCELSVRSAEPETVLNRLAEYEIPFWNVTPQGAFCVTLSIVYSDKAEALALMEEIGAETVINSEFEGYRKLYTLVKRPAILLTLVLIALTVYILPKHVWFVTVSGNRIVPTDRIVRAASDFGIRFWTENQSINSERFRNEILSSIPELRWAAVNCSGGICEIVVREKNEMPERTDRRIPCDVEAMKTGTIVRMSVTEGQAVCAVGETVTAGQTLVSGINPYPVRVQQIHAQAEIYARTWYQKRAVTPVSCVIRGRILEKNVCRYIQIGNFRLKLGGRGMGCGSCAEKTRELHPLTLPGGYVLPAALIVETETVYDPVRYSVSDTFAEAVLKAYAERAVMREVTAGTILTSDSAFGSDGGLYVMDAAFSCTELISGEKPAAWSGSERNNGENSERGTD